MNKRIQKSIENMNDEIQKESLQANKNRARSLSVGTAFGGTTEISMRANDGSVLWCTMQPVEIMELIHQLSANIGCLISVIPRQDFSSWRDWRLSPEELAHYRGIQHLPAMGWPPHSNDMDPHRQIGISTKEQIEKIPLSKGASNQNENVEKKIELGAEVKPDITDYYFKQMEQQIIKQNKLKSLQRSENETLATKENIN